MRYKHHLSISSLLLLGYLNTSPSLYAAEMFPDAQVPIDVVRDLFQVDAVYRGLPDNFPITQANPALQLRIIGSSTSGIQHTVMLTSGVPGTETLASLKSQLESDGWVAQSNTPTTAYVSMCHDEKGILTINTGIPSTSPSAGFVGATNNSMNQVRLSWLNLLALAGGTANFESLCGATTPNTTTQTTIETLIAAVPVLENPSGTELPEQLPGFFSVYPSLINTRDYSTAQNKTTINQEGLINVSDSSAAQLLSHYNEQLREAHWVVDTSSSGDTSAASIWYHYITVNQTEESLGTSVRMTLQLSIIEDSSDSYLVTLTILADTALASTGGSIGIRGIAPFVINTPVFSSPP